LGRTIVSERRKNSSDRFVGRQLLAPLKIGHRTRTGGSPCRRWRHD